MKYILSLVFLVIALITSNFILTLFDLRFPPAVLGMILLLVALKLNWIKLKQIEPTGNQLLKYFPLFFIPAGVGIIQHLALVQQNLLLIIVSVGSATLVTLLVVAKVSGFLFNKKEQK